MGKRKRTTIGFSYFMGLHMGLCRGPINQISMIKIGGRVAYDSGLQIDIGTEGVWPPTIAPEIPNYSQNQIIDIIKPELFGGTKAEGGVNGKLWLLNGGAAQEVPEALKNMLGNPDEQPEFRGVTTVYFDGMICQMNPYPKPWRFLVRRTTEGWDGATWYPEKCSIIYQKPYDPDNPYEVAYRSIMAMNGAHILYECLTNRQWGRGLPASRLDVQSFRQAADTLYDEQLGLCLRWNRTDTIENFVQLVLDHIGGVTRLDKVTGLYTLKLLRFDYDPDTLPVYTTDNGILEIAEASSGAAADAINEVVVNYFDPILDIEAQVKVQNIAAIQTAGSVATRTVDYRGCPTDELALRLAQRDLRAGTTNLRRFRIVADRRLWRVQPGDVIKISDAIRNIGQVILRVGTVEDGTLTNGKITIVAVQDVFSYQLSPFGGVQPPLGTVPDFRPTAKRTLAYEKPYVELNREYPLAEFEALPNQVGIYNYHMERPSALAMGFDTSVKRGVTGTYNTTVDSSGDFTPLAALTGTLDYLDTQLTYSEQDNINMDLVEPGTPALIGDEFIRVEAVDLENHTLTIARGVMDTRPHRHTNGALIWFTDDFGGTDYINYAASEQLFIKGQPFTLAGGKLPLDDAPEEEVVMDWRKFRPYTPGDVQAATISTAQQPWFNTFTLRYDADGYYEGDIWVNIPDILTLTWTHRDRIAQADQLVDHMEGDIGPEPGVTYRARVLNAQGVPVRTETGITGAQFTYTYAQAASDLQVETEPEDPVIGFIELYSMRDGLTSWQGYLVPIQVYKSPEPQMAMAQSTQMVMLQSDEPSDQTGMQLAEDSQQVMLESAEEDLAGVYAAQTTESVGHKAVYLVAMDRRAYEAPYISLLREGRSDTASHLKVCVARPSDRVTDGYDLHTGLMGVGSMGVGSCGEQQQLTSDVDSPYQLEGAHPWTPWAVISSANTLQSGVTGWVDYLSDEILISATSTVDGVPITSAAIGSLILVDDEWMELVSVSSDRLKVKRGVADTVPARHQANRPIWLCENAHAASNVAHSNLDKVKYKLNPHTMAQLAPVDLLPEYNLLMQNRPNRPYPPGLVMVAGDHWFKGASALADGYSPVQGAPKGKDVLITWSYRNKVWQGDQAYDHFAITIPPATGVEYVLELWYRRKNAACPTLQRRIVTDGNAINYTAAMALEDGSAMARALGSCGAIVGQFTLKAVKGGVISWQGYIIPIQLPSDVVCPSDGGDGGSSDDPIVTDPPPGGGDGGDDGANPGNPNPGDPDDPTEPTEPEYPEPTDPEVPDPDFPDTGEPPIEPPEPDPDNVSGWGENWDHGWAGPQN